MPTLTSAPAVPDTVPLPQQISRMDTDRLRGYRENLDFYHGRQWLEPRLRRERRLTFNYARTVIEKTASYTMSGVSSVVDPEEPTAEGIAGARRTEQALREVYEANSLDQLDFDSEIDCSVLGDGAYKVTWDAMERRVRVTSPDVQGLFAWPLGDDPSRYWGRNAGKRRNMCLRAHFFPLIDGPFGCPLTDLFRPKGGLDSVGGAGPDAKGCAV